MIAINTLASTAVPFWLLLAASYSGWRWRRQPGKAVQVALNLAR